MKLRHLALYFLVLTLTTVATSRAHSQDMASAIDAFELPISKGHWKVGGGFSYSNSGDWWWLSVSPEAEYFLIDRLSIGATISGVWSKGNSTTTGVGPSATYYFATDDHWAYFVRQTIEVGHSSYSGTTTEGSSSLGATYFFNKHIGFSPQIRASYGKDRTGTFSTLGSFTIHF